MTTTPTTQATRRAATSPEEEPPDALLRALPSVDCVFSINAQLPTSSMCRLSQCSRAWRDLVASDTQSWRARAREAGVDVLPEGMGWRELVRELSDILPGDCLEVLDTHNHWAAARVLAKVDHATHGPLLLIHFGARPDAWNTWVHRVHDAARIRPLSAECAAQLAASVELAVSVGVLQVGEHSEQRFRQKLAAAQERIARGTSEWRPTSGSAGARWPWAYLQAEANPSPFTLTIDAPEAWLASQIVRTPFRTFVEFAADVAAANAACAAARRDLPAPPPPSLAPTGRTWRVGERVEAADYSGHWYVARIAAVEADGSVRVHFEGWTEKFDEWRPADSRQLRPYSSLARFGPMGSEAGSARWEEADTSAAGSSSDPPSSPEPPPEPEAAIEVVVAAPPPAAAAADDDDDDSVSARVRSVGTLALRLADAYPWARVLVAAASPFRRLLLGGLRLAERCMMLALR